MNRSKRREMERKYGKAFTMQRYREEAIEQGQSEGIKKSIEMIIYMTAYTLNYKLGLGKKRLPAIMHSIIDNIDAYNTGHLSHQDYLDIKEEMNEKGFVLQETLK